MKKVPISNTFQKRPSCKEFKKLIRGNASKHGIYEKAVLSTPLRVKKGKLKEEI